MDGCGSLTECMEEWTVDRQTDGNDRYTAGTKVEEKRKGAEGKNKKRKKKRIC